MKKNISDKTDSASVFTFYTAENANFDYVDYKKIKNQSIQKLNDLYNAGKYQKLKEVQQILNE